MTNLLNDFLIHPTIQGRGCEFPDYRSSVKRLLFEALRHVPGCIGAEREGLNSFVSLSRRPRCWLVWAEGDSWVFSVLEAGRQAVSLSAAVLGEESR